MGKNQTKPAYEKLPTKSHNLIKWFQISQNWTNSIAASSTLSPISQILRLSCSRIVIVKQLFRALTWGQKVQLDWNKPAMDTQMRTKMKGRVQIDTMPLELMDLELGLSLGLFSYCVFRILYLMRYSCWKYCYELSWAVCSQLMLGQSIYNYYTTGMYILKSRSTIFILFNRQQCCTRPDHLTSDNSCHLQSTRSIRRTWRRLRAPSLPPLTTKLALPTLAQSECEPILISVQYRTHPDICPISSKLFISHPPMALAHHTITYGTGPSHHYALNIRQTSPNIQTGRQQIQTITNYTLIRSGNRQKMSKFQHTPIRLNIINKSNPQEHKISIVVGATLTISHLKRKIQTEFHELHSAELVVKLIQDEAGFIISNNSSVEEHFRNGDTVYFSEHDRHEKSTTFNMNMPTNMGEIISTVRFMTGSALEKLDKIDLSSYNVLEIVPEFLHLGFWYTNDLIVAKVYKMFNKIFGVESIEKFVSSCSQVQMSLFVKNLHFWLVEIPTAAFTHREIVWELLQLLQKVSINEKFGKIVMAGNNSQGGKIVRAVQELSKDQNVAGDFKKISAKILKNFSNGNNNKSGLSKIKSAYIPSMLGSSNINAYDLESLLETLKAGSPDEKVAVLEEIATTTNFQAITQASVRYDYYESLVFNIFTIKKLKNRKLITLFNLALSKIMANSSKGHIVEIMQKDGLIKRVHGFMLEGPVETHPAAMELFGKICRVAAAEGMFNLQKSFQFLSSPYPQFQLLMSEGIAKMSELLPNISSLRFIGGIKDCIKNCLKTNNQKISANLLKTLSNLCLDEQCRYQILNLKGIQIFIKFLETSSNNVEICRTASKGLLNLTISSRENKAKVLGMITTILEKFYKGKYDGVTLGYIDTIMKSRNI